MEGELVGIHCVVLCVVSGIRKCSVLPVDMDS